MPIDFGKDGWQIRKGSNGRKQITGRSPRNMRHALSGIVAVEDLSEPGKPTVAIKADVWRYELVKALD